jgi:hypothetical protein
MTSAMEHRSMIGSGLSPRIWGNLPVKNWSSRIGGLMMLEDGMSYAADPYTIVGTVAAVSTEAGVPAIKVTSSTTNNGVTGIQHAGKLHVGHDNRWAFECQFKLDSVADTIAGWAFGLAGAVLANNQAILDDDGTIEGDFIGFHRKEGDGDAIEVQVVEGNSVTTLGSAQVIAADTLYRIGMVYDSNRLRFYMSSAQSSPVSVDDVVEIASVDPATQTNLDETADMFPTILSNAASTTASNATVQLFAFGREF